MLMGFFALQLIAICPYWLAAVELNNVFAVLKSGILALHYKRGHVYPYKCVLSACKLNALCIINL